MVDLVPLLLVLPLFASPHEQARGGENRGESDQTTTGVARSLGVHGDHYATR